MTATMVKLASLKQTQFIRSLLAEREGNPAAEKVRTMLNDARSQGAVSARTASNAITALTAIPANPKPLAVPEGDYALLWEDGVIRFYTVSRGKEGTKWADTLFVSLHVSDERHTLNWNHRQQVLDRIGADPKAAAILYGKTIKHCWRCHKELNRPESLERGMGKHCAEIVGWS